MPENGADGSTTQWLNPLHSVSIADFHIQIGNTITHTWPQTADMKEFKTENLHDFCFPDGAHDAHRDTVYGVLECVDGTTMFGLGCYRALKTQSVERGAVQRGILIITTVPIYNTLNSIVHELLEWWLCSDESVDKYNRLDDNDARTWVDVNTSTAPELLKAHPRCPTADDDLAFLRKLYDSLTEGFKASRDGDRNIVVPFDFDFQNCKVSTELTAPFVEPLCMGTVPASLSDALGYGACLSQLISIFKHNTAKIYTALLKRQTVCFTDHGNAMMVGACVLACTHLVRPLALSCKEVVPYFTVTDSERVETADFVVCGTTNPYYEDAARNPWATLICSLADGSIHCNSQLEIPKTTQKLVSHIVQGVVRENRTEAWIRNFFEWSTARTLLEPGGMRLPLAAKCSPSSYTLDECIKKTEEITSTVTKCHEVNKQKTAIHSDWFSAMLDVLRNVAARSEADQREMYKQISSYQLDEELAGFADITMTGCGSKTERCAIAQLAYEENKTRLLLTELRERVYLLIDNMNRRNACAFNDEENQLFCDTFNSNEYQLYNTTNQVLFLSSACTIEHRSRSDTTKVNGKLWISKNYLGFTCGWLSKLGRSKDKPSIELIPFDTVRAVALETSVVNDGIKVTLMEGHVLYISGLNDSYKVRTLLETLAEKQRRINMMLGALDPVLTVPDLSNSRSPLGIPRKVVIPSGLYLYDRVVEEVVWEHQRSYPVAGWSGKLMPMDPPGFSDQSGKHERKLDERHGVVLPQGWTWLSGWEKGEWMYSTEFKRTGWKDTRSTLDMCRRRKWARSRKLEYDAFGTLLPVMMMPGDRVEEEEEVVEGTEQPSRESEAEAAPRQLENMSFNEVRCRQKTTVPARSPALSPADFRPEAVLPETTAALNLADFTPPSGFYNPYHSTSELPGCGALRYDTLGDEKEAVDSLMAETNGLTGSTTPRRTHRNSIRQFKEDFKQDLKGLKTDLKNSFAGDGSPMYTPRGSPAHPVSRGVVILESGKTPSATSSPDGSQGAMPNLLEVQKQQEGSVREKPKSRLAGLRSFIKRDKEGSDSASPASPQDSPPPPL